ncbi:peptide deformylase [Candidatus Saccharibacteria bacterium]|nr:peptide deformylase [Candidatus Saccharibacteria bacterium]
MTKDDIITVPEPNLRKRSARVGIITEDIQKLISDMIAATIDWEDSRDHEAAVGLAAIQVNQLYRIFIVRNDYDDISNQQFTVFINPEIVKRLGPIEEDFEGCLSVPEIYGKVPRHQSVKVKALNEQGEPFRVTAHGFLARLIQHETDHTHGILFIDNIKDSKQAFFKMNEQGTIEPLDYDTYIKNNSILWD